MELRVTPSVPSRVGGRPRKTTTLGRSRRGPSILRHKQARAALLLLLPFCALLLLFQYYAIGLMVRDSLFSYSNLNSALSRFIGLENFRNLLHDSVAMQSLEVTTIFAAGSVVTQVPLGLLLALFLKRKRRSTTFFRTVSFSPVVLSVVVVSTMWTFILASNGGLANSALQTVGLPSLNFLTSGRDALPSLIVMTLWEEVGFSMVLYLAGLQSIPRECEEAAAIDGASTLQRLRFVTLPLLRRTTLLVTVTATVFSFQAFAQPYIMTLGGPNGTTDFMVYDIYRTAFTLGEPGYASAISVLLLVIVLIVSLAQMRGLRSNT